MKKDLTRYNDSYDSFLGLTGLQRRIDHLFDDFMRPWDSKMDGFNAAGEMEETEDHYLVNFDLPGVPKENIQIDLRDNQLMVSGERKEERTQEQGTRHFTERTYGRFSRVFTLPSSVNSDKVEASYQDGVLRIAVPKTEAAKPKRIQIKEGIGGVFRKLLGKKENSKTIEAA